VPAPSPGAPALPPARPTLAIQDEGQVREVPLADRPLEIGRAPSNDIVLTSRFVSGRHARIEPDGAAHRIIDTGSTNGILSEGRRLPANTPLKLADGDVLRIGDPATGNFVTLTYRNPVVARAAQAGTVAQSSDLGLPQLPTSMSSRAPSSSGFDAAAAGACREDSVVGAALPTW